MSDQQSDEPMNDGVAGTTSVSASGTAVDARHSAISIEHLYAGANLGGIGLASKSTVSSGPVLPTEVLRAQLIHPERDCDDALRQQLIADSCMLLQGIVGSGRRTAVIVLLESLVGPRSIIELSYQKSTELNSVSFERGYGYLLDATSSSKPASLLSDVRQVQRRLESVGSYLIVLAGRGEVWRDAPFAAAWESAGFEQLVAARGFEPPLDIEGLNLHAAISERSSVRDIHSLLDAFADGRNEGKTDSEILSSLPEHERDALREWFGEQRTLEWWTLVSCVAFFNSSPQAEFNGLRERLAAVIEDGTARPSADPAPHADEVNGLVTSVQTELDDCRAEIQTRRSGEDGLSVVRPHVCLQNEHIKRVYLQEYWRGLPQRLRPFVIQWLRTSFALSDVTTSKLIARLGFVLEIDADFWTDLVNGWASTGEVKANVLAARTVDAAASDSMTMSLAFAVAKAWGDSGPFDGARCWSALTVYTGNVGVYQVRQAMRLYRRIRPLAPTIVDEFWMTFSNSCAQTAAPSEALVRVISLTGVVKEIEVSDHIYAMLSTWFQDQNGRAPLALQLGKYPDARRGIARIVARSLLRTYRTRTWLEALVPWMESDDRETTAVAIRLFEDVLASMAMRRGVRRFDGRRFETVVQDLTRHLELAGRQRGGPTPLAIERCEAVISDVLGRVRGRPILDD